MVDFDAVFREYYERVYHWAYPATGNARDAEDLTMRALERVWKRRNLYNPAKSSLCHWIYLNAWTIIVGFWRAKREEALRLDLMPEDRVPLFEGPTETHEARALANEVRSAIDRLPGMVAAVMRLRHLEGRPWNEISQILNMTARNAQYLERKGRELLRVSLAAVSVRAGVNPPGPDQGRVGSFRTPAPFCG
jgi:RNA polymerase sigma-70 factor (ECF subfamily)